MLNRFMKKAVLPCLRDAGVSFLVSGQTVILSAADMTRLQSMTPDKRWPVGELVRFGETVVYVSHTGENTREIIGLAVPVQGAGTQKMVAVGFLVRKRKM